MPKVTLAEAAELEGKSISYAKMAINRGKLPAEKISTENERGHGFTYQVDIADLSAKAQAKYYAGLRDQDAPDIADLAPPQTCRKAVPALDELTARQREDVTFWQKAIKAKNEYVSGHKGARTEKTKEFVEAFNKDSKKQISVRALYDKERLLRDYGAAALADGRMSHDKHGRNIDERLWSLFTQWYLDERKYAVSYIYDILKQYIPGKFPDMLIPSYATIKRAADEIKPYEIEYFRNGNAAFENKCLPYLKRKYEQLTSNEWWSADYHTLDLMVRDDETGEVYRPHIVVWIDVRSRKMLSMRMRKNSDSDGVILSFRDACIVFGIPLNVYLDNGSEFLVHDFGGRGVRKSSGADHGGTILDALGIEMTNAIVKNAKAKVIERQFRKTTEQFAKLFKTYCGSRPGKRPESHSKIMKNIDNIPLASEALADLKAWIDGWYNQKPSKAEGLHGKSPNECYAANLIKKRVLTDAQANLLMLRRAKAQKVDRNGVYITVGAKKIWYYSTEFASRYANKKMYVRYDPDQLQSVRVYDEYEKFIAVLDRLAEGGYDNANDTEAIKQINTQKKKVRTAVKGFIKNQEEIMKAPELREVVMDIARRNIQTDSTQYDAKIIEGSFGITEESEVSAATGTEGLIDFDRMISNIKKSKGRD